jgi:hypothetical protein
LSASDRLIAGYSLTEPDEGWEEILAAFRALGGVAENIRAGRGRFGRGLFPVEPDQPFRLNIPENLIFPVKDVGFAGNRLTVVELTGTPKPERRFFERYTNTLTWGGGARQEMSALIAAFDALPNDVRTLLAADFGMAAWLEGEPAMREQLQFLQSRVCEIDGRDVLVPVLELANHDSCGVKWRSENGVEVAGQASGEILLSYGLHDPFSMFRRFAFASPEPVAFSLPMKVEIGAIALAIERSFEVNRRGDAVPPRLADTGDGLALSFLMLGQSNFPRLPRGAFRALMKTMGVGDADELFDRIVHANWEKFLKLLDALDAHSGALIVGLRNMVLYQLQAMSSCIGARDLQG